MCKEWQMIQPHGSSVFVVLTESSISNKQRLCHKQLTMYSVSSEDEEDTNLYNGNSNKVNNPHKQMIQIILYK